MAKASIKTFLEGWQKDPEGLKGVLEDFLAYLEGEKGVELDFIARPGISYSIRAKHEKQRERKLFVMIDIIDDDPENPWLSVCFYGDMIEDPEELGDFVPQGLLGEDGHCFDLEDTEEAAYIKERIKEAFKSAAM